MCTLSTADATISFGQHENILHDFQLSAVDNNSSYHFSHYVLCTLFANLIENMQRGRKKAHDKILKRQTHGTSFSLEPVTEFMVLKKRKTQPNTIDKIQIMQKKERRRIRSNCSIKNVKCIICVYTKYQLKHFTHVKIKSSRLASFKFINERDNSNVKIERKKERANLPKTIRKEHRVVQQNEI